MYSLLCPQCFSMMHTLLNLIDHRLWEEAMNTLHYTSVSDTTTNYLVTWIDGILSSKDSSGN